MNEAHRLKLLLRRHHQNTGRKAQICVAESKYGTIENYLACFDLGVSSHFESFEKAHRGTGRQKGIFPKRHLRQDDLDIMLEQAQSPAAKRDIKSRQHLMERSFARASRYGLKRARWRRLWRVQIQEYLTASIQNLMVLLRHIKDPSAALSHKMDRPCVDNHFINLNAQVFTISEALVHRSRHAAHSF